MSDQPKPTTGEWTVKTLAQYMELEDNHNYGALLGAINAAIAAEREAECPHCEELREALRWEKQEHAKAWKKVQTLVAALKLLEYDDAGCPLSWPTIAETDAALAKVKKGK